MHTRNNTTASHPLFLISYKYNTIIAENYNIYYILIVSLTLVQNSFFLKHKKLTLFNIIFTLRISNTCSMKIQLIQKL